jgi:hypothetical protein
MLQKQDPAVFDDPEQCLQAPIVKYLAARKLHQEAKAVDGKDPWTWLAVANSYLEQNPVDLDQLPCATMLDGKRKEHYLEPLRIAELEGIHAKAVEKTMEQYIEIDDELPDLTGTSSPTPILTSTSTSG